VTITTTVPQRRKVLIDLAPLRASPAFARLWAGTTVSGIGMQMTVVTVGLQVYHLTGSPFHVGLVGAFALVPVVLTGLYAGSLADAFDRRTVAIISAAISWLTILIIAWQSWAGVDSIWLIYQLTAVNSAAFTVNATTRKAIVPRLIPIELLPAAGALNGVGLGLMTTVGPALAAIVVSGWGLSWAYTIDALLFIGVFTGVYALPRIPPQGEVQRAGLRSIATGLAFLRNAPNLRLALLLDVVAMALGSPRVLFPAIGALVFGGGAGTVAVLASASAAGALLCGLFSGPFGQVRWHGRWIIGTIAAYGACIAAFGFIAMAAGERAEPRDSVDVVALTAAAVVLAIAGAVDNVSAIFRTTMLQAAVPDAMRGRLQGVYMVVVTSGPRVGDLVSGSLASLAFIAFPSIIGGLGIIGLVALLSRGRSLAQYDAITPRP